MSTFDDCVNLIIFLGMGKILGLTLLVHVVVVVRDVSGAVIGGKSRHTVHVHIPRRRPFSIGSGGTFNLERSTSNTKVEVFGKAPGLVLCDERYLTSRWESIASYKWRGYQRARWHWSRLDSRSRIRCVDWPNKEVPKI